jgi:RNA polymerase sigma factor (TIGR02999 family)
MGQVAGRATHKFGRPENLVLFGPAIVNELTHIFQAVQEGDPHAASRLLPLVYDELRRLAARQLAREPGGQTLQPTALVHEAYLRLVPRPGRERAGKEPHWDNRGHFFAAAAEAMRRILIDNARRKQRPKHGGDRHRVSRDIAAPEPEMRLEDLLALDEALEQLAEEEPVKAGLVKLRFFAGLSMPEVAEVLGISLATAERHWTYARTWLFARLQDAVEASSG